MLPARWLCRLPPLSVGLIKDMISPYKTGLGCNHGPLWLQPNSYALGLSLMKVEKREYFPRKCVVEFNLFPLKWRFEIFERRALQECEVMSIISPTVSISSLVLGVTRCFTWWCKIWLLCISHNTVQLSSRKSILLTIMMPFSRECWKQWDACCRNSSKKYRASQSVLNCWHLKTQTFWSNESSSNVSFMRSPHRKRSFGTIWRSGSVIHHSEVSCPGASHRSLDRTSGSYNYIIAYGTVIEAPWLKITWSNRQWTICTQYNYKPNHSFRNTWTNLFVDLLISMALQ